MVDSHAIAVGTVTLIGVALFIRSISGAINASSHLIQAASRLIKMIVALFKNLSCPNFLDIAKKNLIAESLAELSKKICRITFCDLVRVS
jgi:hypothetical protein